MFRILVMNGLLISLIFLWTSAAKEASKENLIKSTDKLPTEPLKIIPNIRKWTSAAKEASKENLIKSTDKLPTNPLKIIPNILRRTSAAKENLIKSTDKLPTEPLKILPNIPIWTSAAKESATENMIKSTEKLPTEPLKRTQNIPIWTSAAKESPTENMIKSPEKLPTESLKRIPNEPISEMLSRKFSCGTELGGVCVYHKKSCPKSFPLDKPQGKPYCLKKHRCCYTDPTTAAPTTIVATTTNTEDPTTTDHTTIVATTTKTEDTSWGATINACISGNNYKVYQPVSIHICKAKCVEEETIKCQSIEYSSKLQMCSISQARSNSNDYKEPCSSDGWVFAEIELNTGSTTDGPTTMAPNNSTTNDTDGSVDIPCNWPSGQRFWPHPTNCLMFIECGSSGPVEKNCGPGTAWSQPLLACDHLSNTDCGKGTTPLEGSTTDVPTTMAPNNSTTNGSTTDVPTTMAHNNSTTNGSTTDVPTTMAPNNSTTNVTGPTTGAPTTTVPGNTTTNGVSCNLVWKSDEDRPLIMIRDSHVIAPPVINTTISDDPNRILEGVKLIFACPGENNQFNNAPGLHTKLHGECVSHDLFKVCVNNNPTYMDLGELSCRNKMSPSLVKQDNDTLYKIACEDIGGNIYRIGYIYGDYREFKDLDAKVCFSDEEQTTLWTSTNVNRIEISPSIRYKNPRNFRTARGFVNNTLYLQNSQQETLKEILDKQTTAVWNDTACRNHGGHCVRGGTPCPDHLPHQTSQGEPFCNILYRCCYSAKCHPKLCTYRGKTGHCSLESLPRTIGVGSQECKKGCQCYINDNKKMRQFEIVQQQKEFSKLERGTCGAGGGSTGDGCSIQRSLSQYASGNLSSRVGKECELNLGIIKGHPPLVIDLANDRIVHHSSIHEYGKLVFFCPGSNQGKPNEFKIDHPNCDTFMVECRDGKLIDANTEETAKIQKMGCLNKIGSSVKEYGTTERCGQTDQSFKVFSIGFDIKNVEKYKENFFHLVAGCFDSKLYHTIWTSHYINGKNQDNIIRYRSGKSYNTYGFGSWSEYMNSIYEVKQQSRYFSEELEYKDIICRDGNLQMYLAKGHMARSSDFSTAIERDASNYYLNIQPQWQTINNGNWAAVERRSLELARTKNIKLEVYTGGFDVLKLHKKDVFFGNKIYTTSTGSSILLKTENIRVPAITWKILLHPERKFGIAFVVINNPLEEYNVIPLCDDICNKLKWLTEKDRLVFKQKNRGYTHCCSIYDFMQKYPAINKPKIIKDTFFLPIPID